MLLFTSGTTGRSKGCMLSHRYGPRQARADDRALRAARRRRPLLPVPALPPRRARAHRPAGAGARHDRGDRRALLRLGLLGRGPRVRRDRLRLHGRDAARCCTSAPPQPGRRATTRSGSPGACRCPTGRRTFEQRFGLRLVELYGSTDVGVPIYQPLHAPRVARLLRPGDRRLRRAPLDATARGRRRRRRRARRPPARARPDRRRLLRHARGDRRRPARRLVPHRRPRHARRRRQPTSSPAGARRRSAGAARTSRRSRSRRSSSPIPTCSTPRPTACRAS